MPVCGRSNDCRANFRGGKNVGPLCRGSMSSGCTHLTHAVTSTGTTCRVLSKLGLSAVFAMSCSLGGSFFFCSPSNGSKRTARKSKRVVVVREVDCASRAGLTCGGAFNGRGVGTILTCRIVGCSCRSVCNRGRICKRALGPSLSGNTGPTSLAGAERRSTVISCMKDLGCKCGSGCCTNFDFHHSNSSQLTPSAH